jgi:hypothetical protein
MFISAERVVKEIWEYLFVAKSKGAARIAYITECSIILTEKIIPEIPLALRNQVVHYVVHMSAPSDHVMSPSKPSQHPPTPFISD